MNLTQYQRMKYLKFIRPLFIKTKCEICNSCDDLELHHEKQFSHLLYETLNQLELEYKEDIKYYSDNQRKVITDTMLGKQIKIKYTTVCNECHITIHNLYGKDKPFSKSKVINAKSLGEVLNEKYKGVRIFNSDLGDMELLFKKCGYTERTFGKLNANKFLKILNIPIEIKSKRVKMHNELKTVWILHNT